MNKLKRVSFFSVYIVVVLLLIGGVPFKAYAETPATYFTLNCGAGYGAYGRGSCRGYISGTKATYKKNNSVTDVLSGGLHANGYGGYINTMSNYLWNGGKQDKRGAAFLINTMLGHNGSDFGGDFGFSIQYARDNFGRWQDLMRQFNDAGWINYNFAYNPTISSSWFEVIDDDATHRHYQTGTFNTIRIGQPGGQAYYIQKSCGNSLGTTMPPPPQWSLTADTTVNGSKDIKVPYGTTVTFHSYIRNNGPNNLNTTVNGDFYYPIDQADGTSLDLWNGFGAGGSRTVSRNFTVPNNTNRYCAYVWTDKQASWDGNARWWSEACVTGVPPSSGASVTPVSQSPGNYEKGSATGGGFIIGVNITHPCDELIAVGQQVGSVSYGSTSDRGGAIINSSSPLINCSAPTQPRHNPSPSVNTGFLNNQAPGTKEIRTTTISGVNNPGFPAPSIEAAQTSSVIVYEVPYARFYGQDIHATGEGATPDGTIFFNTKTNGTGGDSAGSASQYAAIAQKLIGGASAADGIKINTAAFRGSQRPSPNNGLKAQWASAPNAFDIYTEVKNNLKINSTPGSQTYSNTNIPVGGVTIAKDGNIYITENITEGKQDKIALFVAGGDIYIKPDVTRIDAVLISNGTIYTCALNSASSPSPNNWQESPTNTPAGCRNTLTINGAVSAKNIKFQRSVGTRLMASAGENGGPTGQAGKGNIDSRGVGNTSTAAEVINYPAYLNFSSLNLKDTSTNSVNAIFNAPPLL